MKKFLPSILALTLLISPTAAFATEQSVSNEQAGSVILQKYNSNFANTEGNNLGVKSEERGLVASVDATGNAVMSDEILRALSNAITASTKIVGNEAIITVTDATGVSKEIKVPLSALSNNGTSSTTVTNPGTTNTTKSTFEYYGYKFDDIGNGKLRDQNTGGIVDKKVLLSYSKPEDIKSLTEQEQYALLSNDDQTRRQALEQIAGVDLSHIEVWDNNEGVPHDDQFNRQAYNTTVKDLKASGNYAANASRQELILHALKTKDWQPYRKMEYRETPLFFTIEADGTYEYNKVYYAGFISRYIQYIDEFKRNGKDNTYNKDLTDAEILKVLEDNLEAYIKKYNDAKGPVVYVYNFNGNEEVAKQYGTTVAPVEFFYSPYNNPNVLSKGTF